MNRHNSYTPKQLASLPTLFLIGASLILVACSSFGGLVKSPTPMSTTTPTTTITPTITTTSTLTETLLPTLTPTQTATPTPKLPVGLGTPLPQPSGVIGPENANQLKKLASLGTGVLYDIKYSPDRTQLRATFSTGVRIYDAQTLEKIHSCSIVVPELPVSRTWWIPPWQGLSHAFSPNGEYFAVLLGDVVKLWRISDCTLVHELELDETLHDCAYQTLQLNLIFSPDNKYLAFAYNPRNCNGPEFARLWRVTDGELLLKEKGAHVTFSPDSSILAIAGFYDGPVNMWQIADVKFLRSVSAPENLEEIAFSQDSSTLAICGEKAIWLWQVSNDKFFKRLFGLKGCRPLYFTEDDQYLRAWNHLWRLSDEQVINSNPDEMPGDPADLDYWWSAEWPPESGNYFGHIIQIAFSPNGNYLGFLQLGSDDRMYAPGTLFLLNLNGMNIEQTYGVESKQNFTFSMDKFALSTGSTIEVRNLADGTLIITIEVGEPQSWGRHMAFSPDGTLLAVANNRSSTVALWQVDDGNLRNSFSGGGKLVGFSLFPDGTQLFGITFESFRSESLVIIKIPSGEFITRQPYKPVADIPNGGWTSCAESPLAISPDGRLVALHRPNCKVSIVQLSNWEVLHTFDVGTGMGGVMAFSPDGRLLATAFRGAEIKLWDVEDGTLVHTLIDHETPITEYPVVELAFSPDGKLLAVAGLGLVNLYGVWP